VLEFYNVRRRGVKLAQPNEAHIAFAQLEEIFTVTIITQNIDDLHERAGSTRVLHLHGEITKARSSIDRNLIHTIGYNDIIMGNTCKLGSQIRPHVVWFGEDVPLMDKAIEICKKADFFIVVGTSLEVYPAAGLVDVIPLDIPKFLVDPQPVFLADESIRLFEASATEGVPLVCQQIRALMA